MSSNESVKKTIGVALGLCVVCSILVSAAAVILKPIQNDNQLLDMQKNLLMTAGLIPHGGVSKEEVEKQLQKVHPILVDLETQERVRDASAEDITRYDERKASKDPNLSVQIPADQDFAGIKVKAKRAKIYLIEENGKVVKVVIPVHGKGLWSTLYGLLVVKSDMQTIEGLSFYDQKETPGLGGEVDNPNWKAQWKGKKIYSEEGTPEIAVIKGRVNPNAPQAPYQIDGLSGATITSQGVTNLLKYWLGEYGLGPFLGKLKVELEEGQGQIMEDTSTT